MPDLAQDASGFRALRPLTRALLVLLAADIVLAWVALQAAQVFLGLVWHGLAGEFLPGTSLAAHGAQFRVLRALQVATWLLTAVLFLAWLHRAHRNLPALRAAGPGFSPGRAVAAFLVPPANLVWPLAVVREIWGASAPDGVRRDGGAPAWAVWWWVLFLATVLGHGGVLALAGRAATPLDLGGPMQALIVVECLEIAAAVLAMVVVGRITRRQEERWAELAEAAPTTP